MTGDPVVLGLCLELVSKIHFRLRENVPQGLKPTIFAVSSGTAEAVPFPKTDF
jgi:hypothetical protein